jgi:hypothetical protein
MFKIKSSMLTSERSTCTHWSRPRSRYQSFLRTCFQAGWSLYSSKASLEKLILSISSGTRASCKQAIYEGFAHPNAES